MKRIKFLMASLILSLSTLSFAEVLEVYTWKAFSGEEERMLRAFSEAAEIHIAEGNVSVAIERLDMGSAGEYQYVMRWDNLADWGEYKDNILSSEKWTSFWTKWSRNPAGELTATIAGGNLDQTKLRSDYDKPYVFADNVWEPSPGRTQEMLQRFMIAKPILEATGARVEIYSEGLGGINRYHYVLLYDSWSDLAASYAKISSSQDWLEFQAANDPEASTLVGTLSGQKLN
tara:strand:+ start:148 stop:840 length:693 start_codon:yes stop_codon:yes gene_type:complete